MEDDHDVVIFKDNKQMDKPLQRPYFSFAHIYDIDGISMNPVEL